ncbi:MAG: hypothetical protein WKF88_05695 [Ferruginibacter sp.]
MDDKEKTMIMIETAQSLKDMIQKRMNNRVDHLTTLQSTNLDALPEEVTKMREVEASRIRAVVSEQKDIIELIDMLFPKAAAGKAPTKKQ